MIKALIVFTGAGLGGVFRYWISQFVNKSFSIYFPFGTLAVNFIGSLILGILIFSFDEKGLSGDSLKLFIGVGFCGGLTTFSTFSFETFQLIRNTEFLLALVNIFSNVIITFIAIYFAYLISR